MRRGIAVFVSTTLGLALSCGSFRDGTNASGSDAGAVDADGADAATDGDPADVVPGDGNACASRAARFAGDDFFELAPVSGFDPVEMTVEAWILIPSRAAAKEMHLVSHIDQGMTGGWSLAIKPGPYLVFNSYVGGSANSIGGSAAATVDVDRWVHVAVTRNNDDVQLLIDGNKKPFSNTFVFGNATNRNLRIGVNSLGGTEPFEGLMEEVRISKVVREILVPPPRMSMTLDATTLGLWRFEENGGDAIDAVNRHRLGEDGKIERVCMPSFASDSVQP